MSPPVLEVDDVEALLLVLLAEVDALEAANKDLPEKINRHTFMARMFHSVMAASVFVRLFTAFLPIVGIRFPWVEWHWMAALVLTGSIIYHIIHSIGWQDFWSMMSFGPSFFREGAAQMKHLMSSSAPEPKSGKYIVFGRDVGGNEFVQLYRYDGADGAVTQLTDGGRSQNGGVRWNEAGNRIAYSSTRRNGADRDVWIMDPANPSDNRLLVQVTGGGWSVQDWSPDDKQLVLVEYLSVNQPNLWLVDAATGAKTRLTPEMRDSVAGFGRHPHQGWMVSNWT